MKLWIARDKDGTLSLSFEKPRERLGVWSTLHLHDSHGDIYDLESDEFPEITYENSPQQVELKLIEK